MLLKIVASKIAICGVESYILVSFYFVYACQCDEVIYGHTMFPTSINKALNQPKLPVENIKAAAPAGGCVKPILTMVAIAKDVASD